ncbi:DDE-type integrase/transposase/recombinase [Paenibacillus campinasensis]|uniref:DDE-type integrase/transposase/recombinase n=2 Tax=Paenibacillus campinasensis TaxID=66347 RepID=A0ABW9TA89_9BACL|nr:DDE-type integrase/transposase/recombinase [Paenibacillus campinasensis]
MDLYSRKIVGFYMDERMTKDLILKALKGAYIRQGKRQGIIHQSDRGSQYAKSFTT